MSPIEPGHPEYLCEDCGRRNIVWFVNSLMWNRLVRESVGYDPMICPSCFVLRAEAQGVMATWEIVPAADTLRGWPLAATHESDVARHEGHGPGNWWPSECPKCHEEGGGETCDWAKEDS